MFACDDHCTEAADLIVDGAVVYRLLSREWGVWMRNR